jgi:hypothetical protein
MTVITPNISTTSPGTRLILALTLGDKISPKVPNRNIVGIVPKPRESIVNAPLSGEPETAALKRNAYTSGQGRNPLKIPRQKGAVKPLSLMKDDIAFFMKL